MTTETQIDILTKARVFITQGWTQRNSARDADGEPVNPHSPDAVTFCVYGALDRTGITVSDSLLDSFRESNGLPPRASLSQWNDAPERTQSQVVKAFDRAIQSLQVES